MTLLALGWLFHPLHGDGYQFWSGIGSDVTELALLGALYAFFRKHNCHVRGCWRLGHPDAEHGFPACRRHHTHARQLGRAPRYPQGNDEPEE